MLLVGTLHHIDTLDKIPNNRIKSIDDLDLFAVDNLIKQGQSAMKGEKSWMEWTKRFNSSESRLDVLQAGLGSRLAVDDWANKILVS